MADGEEEPMSDLPENPVRGFVGTFEDAVEAEVIPRPPLLGYNEWRTWRRDYGKRPLARRDGRMTTPREESRLWRAMMELFHGDDWRDELARRVREELDEEPDEEEEEPDPPRGRGGRATSSSPAPVAGAGVGSMDGGDGEVPARALETPRREGGHTSGTSGFSERPSPESTSGAASPETLLARTEKDYDPKVQTLEEYKAKVRRRCEACVLAGLEVDVAGVKKRLLKAGRVDTLHGRTTRDKVQYLKQVAADLLLDEEEKPDQELELEVVMDLLRELGVEPSASINKLFSSAGSKATNSGPVETTPEKPAGLDTRARDAADRAPSSAPAAGAAREPQTPPRRSWQETSPGPAGSASRAQPANLEDLLHRLDRVEQASSGSVLATALDRQTEILRDAVATQRSKTSTIKVSPTIKWPQLDDGDHDVEEFFEQFDEVCDLANDGQGMRDDERLKVLRSCLKGSREKIYKVIHKLHTASGLVKKDPEQVFGLIKARLMRFVETDMEKQTRYLNEWDALEKGKMTALQFEPLWERSMADLDRVGLGRSTRELLLAYLKKVGPQLSAEIQKDQRPWPDGEGGKINRRVTTWEEAHKVAVELESLKAGTKALQTAFSIDTHPQKEKGKEKKKEKEVASSSVDAYGAQQGRGVCFDMRDKGSCSRGDSCRFSHDPAALREARKAQKMAQEQAGQVAAGGKGKDKGKGKGKPRSNTPGPGKRAPFDSEKLCRYILEGQKCPYGKDCRFSHDKQKFMGRDGNKGSTAQKGGESGKGKGKGKKKGAQDVWAPPSGLAQDQSGGKETSQQTNQQNRRCDLLWGQGVVMWPQAPMAVYTQSATVGLKQPASWQNDKKKRELKESGVFLDTLEQLPESWWVEAPNGLGGYNYRTVVQIANTDVETLLDGGAGVNSVTEELVVGAINTAHAAGVYSRDPEYPVAQLEYYPTQECVTGIARGATVKIVGSVVLRVRMREMGKSAPGPMVMFRCKIFSKGSSDWHGLIIGGQALDCPERGGLGHRPTMGAHVFESLGIMLPRAEELGWSRTSQDGAYFMNLRPSVCEIGTSAFDPFEVGATKLEELQPKCVGMLLSAAPDPVSVLADDGVWLPVVRAERDSGSPSEGAQEFVQPLASEEPGGKLGTAEVIPGEWGNEEPEGYVFLANPGPCDATVSLGDPVAAVVRGESRTAGCRQCGFQEHLAVLSTDPTSGGDVWQDPGPCPWCGADSRTFQSAQARGSPDRAVSSPPAGGAASRPPQVCHIREEPGAMDYLSEVLRPTEEYYAALRLDMGLRHPKCSVHVLDHLLSLEALLDVSILSGFSFGCDKAVLMAEEGNLLGDVVGRTGRRPSGERVQSLMEFAPIKTKQQMQQFLGCTNWLRWNLRMEYAGVAKTLTAFLKDDAEFPERGLGPGDTEADKAVRSVKKMAKEAIELAVLDEAAAIQGTRPLEQVADSSGYAWGGMCLQMTADKTQFKVLLTAGKGLTPAQQAWAPLTLEGYAQLEMKRAQRRSLGSLWSYAWTDHANWTKQQVALDIDVKHLRWVAEITSDGTEIRSLSGRSAKLGDGLSRNPADRDELLEQRSKELTGVIGQARGFNVDEYLGDWEDPSGGPLPWTLSSDAVPEARGSEDRAASSPPAPSAGLCLAEIMAQEGVRPKLTVLYVPDYVPPAQRRTSSSLLWQELSGVLPAWDIGLVTVEGPFEDSEGNGAFFDQLKSGITPAKAALSRRRDLLTSVIKVAREVEIHRPALVVGEGQGGIVACALSKPLMLEVALASRNVQVQEAQHLGAAWMGIKAVAVRTARISKTKLGLDVLKVAAPELWEKTVGWEPLRLFAVDDRKSPTRAEEKDLYAGLGAEVVESIKDPAWEQLLAAPRPLAWEHDGRCICGRRAFLFGQCAKCAKEDAQERLQKAEEEHSPELLEDAGSAERPEEVEVMAVRGPAVCMGASTPHVLFLTQSRVVGLVELARRLAQEGGRPVGEDWHPLPPTHLPRRDEGYFAVEAWKKGRALSLRSPTGKCWNKCAGSNSAGDYPYRLILAVTPGSGVFVVQQCVPWKYETQSEVRHDVWSRPSAHVRVLLQLTAVQNELEEAGDEFCRIPARLVMDVQLRKLAELFGPIGVLRGAQIVGYGALGPRANIVARDAEQYAKQHGLEVVVLRRGPSRWELGPAAPGGIGALLFLERSPELERSVVTVVSRRWMLFDRFGSLADATQDLLGAVDSAAAQAGGDSVVGACDSVDRASCSAPAPGAALYASVPEPMLDAPWYRIKDGFAEMTPEAEEWYEQAVKSREKLAAEVREEAGDVGGDFVKGLRVAWLCGQRADPEFGPMMRDAKALKEGYRLAGDGLLERAVVLKGSEATKWVPVVPAGYATAHMTWKRWAFLQAHAGLFGAHRPPDRTLQVLCRCCWWPFMKQDVERWVASCMTCIRFRKRPTRQEMVAVKPVDVECWEEVMVDVEGPSHPADESGNVYTLTYICCLCQGLHLEPMRNLTKDEVRRAFARCVFRAGTLPQMLRSDRGQEFTSTVMQEYTALCGVKHKFGNPWRPCEQGKVERVHQTTQMLMGMLVVDIMKSHAKEWTEMLPIIEFLVYNTPGPHGFTPRDLDRRWSVLTPLEKELQPFQVMEFEPVSEYVRNVFRAYREVRARVVGWYASSSKKRAELANRFRRSRVLRPGMHVVYRDPRARAAGGRTPWRQPLSEPCEVLSVSGNTCTLKRPDGSVVEHAHVEDLIVVPESARDLEKAPVEFDEGVEPVRRSPGQMLEDDGAARDAQQAAPKGKLAKVALHNYVAYAVSGAGDKRCRIGQVVSIHPSEAKIVVHRHQPLADGRLRVKWEAVYYDQQGQEVLGSGTRPSLETVPLKQVVAAVQLHSGVLSHAAARKLDRAGWRLEDSSHPAPALVMEICGSEVRAACSPPAAGADSLVEICGSEVRAVHSPPATSADSAIPGEPAMALAVRLEEFAQQANGRPEKRVRFDDDVSLQKWLAEGYVDFMEVYCGSQEMTFRVREAGAVASEGLDKNVVSYGQVWDLSDPVTRRRAAWLVAVGLKPRAVHTGTPCTQMSIMGARSPDEVTELLVEFSMDLAEHQMLHGCLYSNESPRSSLLTKHDAWVRQFGPLERPRAPWSYYRTHGCQLGVATVAEDAYGQPMFKPQDWLSNFDLSEMQLFCNPSAALLPSSHAHAQIRGTAKGVDGKWYSLAEESGRYRAEGMTVYARCLARALRRVGRRRRDVETRLSRIVTGAGVTERACGAEVRAVFSPPVPCAAFAQAQRAHLPVFVVGPTRVMAVDDEAGRSGPEGDVNIEVPETEAERTARTRKLREDAQKSEKLWKQRADAKQWDEVRADLRVYDHCGEKISEDPRRTQQYRDSVCCALKLSGDAAKEAYPHLSAEDLSALREVMARKAGALWIDGAPRTTVLHMQHDTIATGPPCRTPPHNLKGEQATWVDDKLEEEVNRGQLVRGSSPWGSPPFPTKDFATHRRQRKRRLVVDYRRVNQRTRRAVYHTRRSDDVKNEAAGSVFLTFLDAVAGFNQVANTRRAQEMLAILSRTGQFLPTCLTFGPVNGPEDFSYVVDRIFSPGSRASRRFCREWLAYIDDLTVRTGRCVDGVLMTDAEHAERIKHACMHRRLGMQSTQEALEALGADGTHLGEESWKPGARRAKSKYDPRESDRNSPYAHVGPCLVGVFGCVLGMGSFSLVVLSLSLPLFIPMFAFSLTHAQTTRVVWGSGVRGGGCMWGGVPKPSGAPVVWDPRPRGPCSAFTAGRRRGPPHGHCTVRRATMEFAATADACSAVQCSAVQSSGARIPVPPCSFGVGVGGVAQSDGSDDDASDSGVGSGVDSGVMLMEFATADADSAVQCGAVQTIGASGADGCCNPEPSTPSCLSDAPASPSGTTNPKCDKEKYEEYVGRGIVHPDPLGAFETVQCSSASPAVQCSEVQCSPAEQSAKADSAATESARGSEVRAASSPPASGAADVEACRFQFAAAIRKRSVNPIVERCVADALLEEARPDRRTERAREQRLAAAVPGSAAATVPEGTWIEDHRSAHRLRGLAVSVRLSESEVKSDRLRAQLQAVDIKSETAEAIKQEAISATAEKPAVGLRQKSPWLTATIGKIVSGANRDIGLWQALQADKSRRRAKHHRMQSRLRARAAAMKAAEAAGQSHSREGGSAFTAFPRATGSSTDRIDGMSAEESAAMVYPPGSWVCAWCGKPNFPKSEQCSEYVKGVACGGSQWESWGGYKVPPKEAPRKNPPSHAKHSGSKRSRETRARQRKASASRKAQRWEDAAVDWGWPCPRCADAGVQWSNAWERSCCSRCSCPKPAISRAQMPEVLSRAPWKRPKEEAEDDDDEYDEKEYQYDEEEYEYDEWGSECGDPPTKRRKRAGKKHKKSKKKRPRAGIVCKRMHRPRSVRGVRVRDDDDDDDDMLRVVAGAGPVVEIRGSEVRAVHSPPATSADPAAQSRSAPRGPLGGSGPLHRQCRFPEQGFPDQGYPFPERSGRREVEVEAANQEKHAETGNSAGELAMGSLSALSPAMSLSLRIAAVLAAPGAAVVRYVFWGRLSYHVVDRVADAAVDAASSALRPVGLVLEDASSAATLVVEEAGYGVRMLIRVSVCATAVCVVVRAARTAYVWGRSAKVSLAESGFNPEGNMPRSSSRAASQTREPPAGSRRRAAGSLEGLEGLLGRGQDPPAASAGASTLGVEDGLSWMTSDALSLAIRSYTAALEISDGGQVSLVSHSGSQRAYRVGSQSGTHSYLVRLDLVDLGPRPVESFVVSCSCPDHQRRGPVCKHAGAVLMQIRAMSRKPRGSKEDRAPVSAPASSAGLAPTGPVEPTETARPTEATSGCFGWRLLKTKAANEHRKSVQFDKQGASASAGPQTGAGSLREPLVPVGAQPKTRSKSASVSARSRASLQSAEERELSRGPVIRAVGSPPVTAAEAPPVGLGRVLRILNAVQAHEAAIGLLGIAQPSDAVWMLAYTLDRADVCDALVSAKERGLDVRVGVDEKATLKGQTRDQPAQVKRLIASGVEVRLVRGKPLGPVYREVGRGGASGFGSLEGMQHSKCMLVGDHLIVGSANWTTATRANHEMAVLIQLDAGQHVVAVETFKEVFNSGSGASEAMITEAQRSRSASPSSYRGRSRSRR